MLYPKNIDSLIGFILLLGTLFAASITLCGGIWFLWQHGMDPIQYEFLMQTRYIITLSHFDNLQNFYRPSGLIELGLIILVLTQLLRVGLLMSYYIYKKDRYFTLISTFIFLVLSYSLFFHH